VLQKDYRGSRLKEPTKHLLNLRRYNVGFSRGPQPDLYQIRYALPANVASDIPFEALPNSLSLKRVANQ